MPRALSASFPYSRASRLCHASSSSRRAPFAPTVSDSAVNPAASARNVMTVEATSWLNGRAGPPRFAPPASDSAVTTAAAVMGTTHASRSRTAWSAATSVVKIVRYVSLENRISPHAKNAAYASR